ncbi:uncharacterized protein LOC120006466 [Tripterygium wilfordii]|uniref:uncharacterized protein LOC120006466 n=1 Tax=Tripterygium wilfordii TaxID=458696 RepID=UPI0018F83577|nr:uncharacterized protein LOC120006466 [Tripterygium wilfordii]
MTRLLEDIGSKGKITFISDRQKGLVHVLEALEGQHEHRFCVRHMYNNISKRFPGIQLKELMWKAARATYREAWERDMKEIEKVNPGAYAELNGIDPRLWCKSHFSGYAKCDTLLNNMSETFNSTILKFREKPIATMLDEIKGYFMTRWAENRIKINRYQGNVLPKIKKKLEIEHKKCGKWLPKWAGDMKFEVICMQQKFVVDLDAIYCSCRKWDLTGIPCRHAVSCIYSRRRKIEEFEPDCFKREAFNLCYSYLIYPTEGPERWPKTQHDDILPPSVQKATGRPKKKRRREAGELLNGKASKVDMKMRCNKCGGDKLNARTCSVVQVLTQTVNPIAGVPPVRVNTAGNSVSSSVTVPPMAPTGVANNVRPRVGTHTLAVIGARKSLRPRVGLPPVAVTGANNVRPRGDLPPVRGTAAATSVRPNRPLTRQVAEQWRPFSTISDDGKTGYFVRPTRRSNMQPAVPKIPVFRPQTRSTKYYGPNTYTVKDPCTGAVSVIQGPSYSENMVSAATKQASTIAYEKGNTTGSSSGSTTGTGTQQSVNK